MTELVINTKYGQVEGFTENGISKWYGIPYAKPPIGDLRFRRAVACDPWKDVKKCTSFGNRPVQFKLKPLLSKKGDSEDCLYLNIWRKNNDAKNLPVYVWIHGGYLFCYAAHDSLYVDESFANEDIIYISVGYRLGPLGCFDFSIYNKDAFDSNCCLSDQIMALKWIKENIAAFGGDPNNITINGESAGGSSILALLTSPSAKGLFQKAICQSGYCDGNLYPKANKIFTDLFLDYLKIKPEEIEKLKTIDIKSLQDANHYVFSNVPKYPGMFFPGFVYDDLLPEDCYTSLRNGSADGIKLIIGTTKDEATFVNIFHECPKNKEEIKQMFENNNMSDKFKDIEDYYFIQKKGGDCSPSVNFGRDYIFFLGSTKVADILSSEKKQDVWVYRFDFMPPLLKILGLKATHSIDIQTIFDKEDDILGKLLWLFTRPSSKKILNNVMHNSWLNFIKTGNPNGDHLTMTWEKYDSEKRKTLMVDRETTLVENPEKEKIEFWKNVIKTHRFYNSN